MRLRTAATVCAIATALTLLGGATGATRQARPQGPAARERVIVLLRHDPVDFRPDLVAARADEPPGDTTPGEARNRWRGRRDAAMVLALDRSAMRTRFEVTRWIGAQGGRVTHRYRAFPAVAATVPASLVDRLRAHPGVAAVFQDRQRDARLATLPATLGLSAFTSAGITGGSVDVAVVDTGVADERAPISPFVHPAFQPLLATSPQRVRSVISLAQASQNCPGVPPDCDLSPFEDPSRADDVHGHGTEVAGAVASQGFSGFPTYVGVAAGLRTLINVKAAYLTAAEGLSAFDSDVIAGIDAALQLDGGDSPEVVNYSFGSVTFIDPGNPEDPYDQSQETLARFLDAVVATFGKVVTVAAGNNGCLLPGPTGCLAPIAESVESPAIGYNVLAVGAADTRGTTSRADDVIWIGSARGPAKRWPLSVPGRKKPDLVAPGGSVRSTNLRTGGLTDATQLEAPGTSLSAGVLAGLAALVHDLPDLGDGSVTEPNRSRAVRALLINSAEDRGAAGWDSDWGWGYVDAGRAYAQRTFVRADALSAGTPRRFYRRLAASASKATLVWDRPVAYSTGSPAPSALKNLDLRLYGSGDGLLRTASISTVDNVEQVAWATAEGVVLLVESPAGFGPGESTVFALAHTGGFAAVAPPGLGLTLNTPASVAPGGTFPVSATLVNPAPAGSLPATIVSATLSLPGGFTLEPGSPPTQTPGALPAGTSATVTWTVRAPASATPNVVLQATAASSGFGLALAAAAQATTRAASECTVTVLPASLLVAAAGGTQVLSVSTAPGCGWAAVSAAPWIGFTPPASGTGGGTVTVGIAAHTGDDVRTATLHVGDAAVSVTQQPPVRTYSYYLAEGATSAFFDTRIALLNPGFIDTTATLTFSRADASEVTTSVPVPARTRVTVDPKTIAGMAIAEFSTRIEADQPLVVDRTMRWDAATGYGSHAETAVLAPATTWYLAEGATLSGFDLFYLLQNPSATPAEVTVRYLLPSGDPLEKDYVLPPTSRTNIWVDLEEFPTDSGNFALANAEVSAVIQVTNGVPIIVERAMYLSSQGRLFNAGHESAGIPAPATEWFLAEGATGEFFDLFVLIANPTSAAAEVEVTYLLPDGTSIPKTHTVAANSRFNIWVDLEYGDPRLASTAVSTTVRSTNGVPIIVERAMWWPGELATWYEAHNSAGVTATGTRWALAEGEVDPARGLETFLLVANTSATPATVRVTLLFEDGTTRKETWTGVPPRSRFNVWIGQDAFPEAIGRRFGAIVESLGTPAAQIVVERAMYSNADGVFWAAGTNAVGTRLP